MTGEDEVGCRWQHLEAQRRHRGNHCLATGDHLLASLLEVFTILERRGGAGNGDAIQRIGVEAVLDALQRLDQIRMPNRQTNAQTGQRTRLGQRLGHQQVRIAIDQCNGRLAAEIDVGLVHQHHGIGIGLQQSLDGVQTQHTSGGCVGVGEDDAAIGTIVIGDLELKALVQRDGFVVDAVEPAVDRIEAVGHVGKQ